MHTTLFFICHTAAMHLPCCRMMITAVLADRKPVDLHIFRNYESPSEMLDPQERGSGHYPAPPSRFEQLLWKAARASGAAPSYFRCLLILYHLERHIRTLSTSCHTTVSPTVSVKWPVGKCNRKRFFIHLFKCDLSRVLDCRKMFFPVLCLC